MINSIVNVIEKADPLVITIRVPGIRGPIGKIGKTGEPGRSQVIELPTTVALGGHRAVRSLAGDVVYANSTDLPGANLVLGITTGSSAPGDIAYIQTAGLMTEGSWAWLDDFPIFCGEAGVLTQTPPALGFSLIVGIAISATQIFLGPRPPIFLLE